MLGMMGCFPTLPLLTDEMCQHMSVDFHFGFPGLATACMFGGQGEEGVLKKIWHLGCI